MNVFIASLFSFKKNEPIEIEPEEDILERFFRTGEIRVGMPWKGKSWVKLRQSVAPGKAPGQAQPFEWSINCADKRLWIADFEGNPVEYKLERLEHE